MIMMEMCVCVWRLYCIVVEYCVSIILVNILMMNKNDC